MTPEVARWRGQTVWWRYSSPPFPPQGVNWRGFLLRHKYAYTVAQQVIARPTGRVVVFVDHNNAYKDARRAFFEDYDPGVMGQYAPRLLGDLLIARGPAGRTLEEVRLYTGRPDGSRDARTYAAHMRQSAAWAKQARVRQLYRALRYPPNYPASPAVQKGVDVALAVDVVRLFVEKRFDVGIVVSTDTDLVPALEAVIEIHGSDALPIEVAAWRSERSQKRLRVAGKNVYCFELALADYGAVRDLTDYNIPTH